MWQKEEKDSSIVSLALLLALATIPITTTVSVLESALAQSSADVPSFALPRTVPSGTTVSIDGSSSMAVINQTLKQRFEKQFSGTKVEVTANGTDAALKALQNRNIDLAAISRELTPQEKALGLVQVVLHREKIAIVVGEDNSFKGSLSSKEFAQIFRGEITDWSQVGGAADTIRFIDRPTRSDTRKAFRNYPVFQDGKFATGSTAMQLNEDSTPELVKQLGKDGISYILANQASKLQGVRIIEINQSLPKDSRYPFSQPLVYVYKKNPDASVINFLGFATASVGQKAIEEATAAEAVALASGLSGTVTTATNTPSTTQTATSTTTASPSATPSPSAQAAKKATTSDNESFLTSISKNGTAFGLTPLLWLLLPLFALGGFLLWWFKRRRLSTDKVVESTSSMPSKEAAASEMSTSSMPSKEAAASEMSNLNIAVTISEVEEDKPSESVANETANSTPAGASALTDGALLSVGVSSPLWSKFLEKGSNLQANNKTIEPSNNTEVVSPGEGASHTQKEVAKNTNSSLRQPNVTEVVFDLEAPVKVVNSVYRELPEVTVPSNVASSAKPPDVSIASFAETTETEDMVETVSNQPKETTGGAAGTGIASGVAIDEIRENANLDVKSLTISTDEAAPEMEERALSSLEADFESQIILKPRTPKWGYAFWAVSESKKEALRNSGGCQLVLRLYDVTHIDLSYQSPQLIQQYECEETIHDRYVAIPMSDRNYMAEIGYVTNDNRWLLLARSAIVRVFSRPDQDFWFVADAELIIHGAAEPGSTVTLEGHAIKLNPDGTFHLRIPFTDKFIDYGMTAIAANGEETKTIHMQFSHDTPGE
ncbi:MAG: DUF4912 domain-containing protein [Stigonema ocellatum SAG 48.90 = DSM 106950]|nr:DUF4912 domain-containing protein [Stigonema ocellatum SAG 48.90 = DSM 106950]